MAGVLLRGLRLKLEADEPFIADDLRIVAAVNGTTKTVHVKYGATVTN